MSRAYNVVDADGHVLEPLDLWDKYMDPKFRDRAPRLIKDKDGKERLVIEEQVLGSAQAGLGGAGGGGARQGGVARHDLPRQPAISSAGRTTGITSSDSISV